MFIETATVIRFVCDKLDQADGGSQGKSKEIKQVFVQRNMHRHKRQRGELQKTFSGQNSVKHKLI